MLSDKLFFNKIFSSLTLQNHGIHFHGSEAKTKIANLLVEDSFRLDAFSRDVYSGSQGCT